MSRKDYVAIAQAVADARLADNDKAEVALKIAAALAADNPRFDRERFLKAAMGVRS